MNHKNFITCDKSSVLLGGSRVRFDKKSQLEQRKYIEIDKACLIKATFIFETNKGKVKIGSNVHIGEVTIISRNSVTIENDVTIAWGVMIYDHNSHSIYWSERANDNKQCYKDYFSHNRNNLVNKNWTYVKDAPVHISSKVWIGYDVLILKGVTIGEGAVVAAKSVVTKNVPPWTLVAGNPAKVVKNIDH